ncbi:DUF429 domain-containing protein [Flavobacteriaceae bacterium 14752]|uniref:DUF429 domain-containing protein n=1 Tax=Mesohalobacter salilacus TaxID=2491711 RepID=UPI000F640ACC|nr:DUF429 domain-containing protein [Flavobacteriaceae bacterium 14752]
MTNFIGLDACKMGWCGIGQIDGGLIWDCFKSLEDLIKDYPQIKLILIDIPIGLSSKHFNRTIDVKARTYLNKRKSSIFSPPCREALYTKNYKEALEFNRKITGKGISIQAYNISPKIKAVDEWLNTKPKDLDIYEAHPELCFKSLNNNKDLKYSKHDKTGLKERQNLLFTLDQNLKSIYEDFLKTYKRKQIKPDDILDAMALYLIAKKQRPLQYISDKNNKDATGIPVQIVFG